MKKTDYRSQRLGTSGGLLRAVHDRFVHVKHLACALALLLSGIFTLTGLAQNINRPNIEGPNGLFANSYTGGLYQQRSDLFIPGRGLSIDISFSYNSGNRGLDLGFGYGWSFSYSSYFYTDSLGVVIVNSDGREDHYRSNSGIYTAATGSFNRLVELQPGTFKVISKEKIEYFYESSVHKRLTKIRDLNGNEIVLSYAGSNLTEITDPSGRKVSLSWAMNRVAEIKTVAPVPTRTIRYTYDLAGCLKSVKDPMNHTINYDYAPGRLLNSATDKNGNPASITYNANHAVIRFVSCEGEKTISYNAGQRKTYVTEKNGGLSTVTSFEFDTTGRLKEKSGNCCGFKNSFTYDDGNNISKKLDALGHATYFTYDQRGNLLSETDALGNTVVYKYDTAFNKIVSITDKKANTTTFKYDTRGNLSEIHYPLNILLKYSYDTHGNKISFTDSRNNTTTYQYDLNGYNTEVLNPDGGVIRYSYDLLGNQLTQIDANNHQTRSAYDALGRILTVTDPLNGITTFTYDGNGNVLTAKDANNNITNYVYNSSNKVLFVNDAAGSQTAMSYDVAGNLVSVKDGNGNTSNYEYDNLRRLISATNAEGEKTGYSYDPNGNKTLSVSPNGNSIEYVYDELHRIREIKDDAGSIEKYTYDASSNRVSYTNATGGMFVSSFDAAGRLVKETDDLGNAAAFEYDPSGNLLKATDRMGNITEYSYDVMDRVLSVKDPQNHLTTYRYDKAGNLLEVKDPKNNATIYSYDALNRNLSERFADNTQRKYTYDPAGNLITREDNAGVVLTYSFDKLNRLLTKTYAAGIDSFSYDATGRPLQAKSPDAKIYYTYDKAGRITTETLNGKSTTYKYNAASGRKEITYPSGRKVEFKADKRGNVSAIASNGKAVVDYTYNALSQNTAKTFGNKTSGDYTYQNKENLTAITFNPGSFVDLRFSYDKGNNIAETKFAHRNQSSEQYTYDNLRQLTRFAKGSSLETYSYDPVGNRSSANINGSSFTYGVNNMNAYNTITGQAPITYDMNGNVTQERGRQYRYDEENRLTRINNGAMASYVYDALGRRIQKNLPSDTTRYFYDGAQVIEERNEQDAVLKNYVWGLSVDEIVASFNNGRSYYYHNNATGSVMAVTDSNGTVVERYEYDAFGRRSVFSPEYAVRTVSAIDNSIGFTGKIYDTEAGLYYSRARVYDPVNGRFLQRDPLGYVDGFNNYAYVANDPVNYVDPLGTIRWKQAGIAFAGVVGNGLGVAGGVALGAATSWTGIGAVVGGAVAVKSAYGFGANLGNLVQALRDEDPGSTGALLNDLAKWYDPCNESLQNWATGADLGLDVIGVGVAGRLALAATKITSKGTTVLGHYPDYVNLANELGARRFQIPTEIWNKMTKSEQWAANQKFLDRMIARADNIRLATPLEKVRPNTFYEQELKYLLDKGYKLSPDGLWLTK
ncbi:MAG: RHS repeat-associated core domain-containing protein [Chitinophagaceae bacterium]